jgi:hypothetical protein
MLRATINTDLRVLKRQAILNIQSFVEDTLSHEIELVDMNATALFAIAWSSSEKEHQADREPYHAISSIIQLLNLKGEILNNKFDVALIWQDHRERFAIDLQDKTICELYEQERHRRKAIF